MLKQLRQKRTAKKVLWVLAIIIIPAFILWGAGGLRESRNCAGIIFGKKVSFDEYDSSFRAVRNKALLTYGSEFYKLQDKLKLYESAWEHLIMLKEAKRRKIKISNREVIKKIASFPVFQDKKGLFNPSIYSMILNSIFRTDPREFEEEIRQFMMIEKLINEVLSKVPEPTEAEIEKELKKEEAKKTDNNKKKPSIEKKSEETEDAKREHIKNRLLTTKKLEIYTKWRDELYKRAGLIDNIKKAQETQKEESSKK